DGSRAEGPQAPERRLKWRPPVGRRGSRRDAVSSVPRARAFSAMRSASGVACTCCASCGPKGGWMVILAFHGTPSLAQERYEQVVRRLTGKTRIESPSELPFDGLLVHAAGEGPNGFCVFDVFASEEAAEVGIEEPPQFFA